MLRRIRATQHTGELQLHYAKTTWRFTLIRGRVAWLHDDAVPTLLRSLMQSEPGSTRARSSA